MKLDLSHKERSLESSPIETLPLEYLYYFTEVLACMGNNKTQKMHP
uniref:Uncharacterized protein n=1 Tax=Anguilla anguilla TaxID=7936 RepID=A0A0E9RDN1_ANGAN